MKNFYKAEYKNEISLRSTANIYTSATFYEASETTFHSRVDLAGKATKWTGVVAAVVPAVQITAAEYKEIQKAQKAAWALVVAERQAEFASNNIEIMFFLELENSVKLPADAAGSSRSVIGIKETFASRGFLAESQIADLIAYKAKEGA
jgi:hypothetical protein